ncbi:hypothetical protein EWB00_005492, partial [Schistosoma japonicum]
YIGSRSLNFYERGSYLSGNEISENSSFMEDIGFQVTSNQFSLQISTHIQKCIFNYDWSQTYYCQSHPEAINGTIVEEQLIHREVISIPYGRYLLILTFIPQPRCLAQTTKNACNTESTPNANCTWCPRGEKCFL